MYCCKINVSVASEPLFSSVSLFDLKSVKFYVYDPKYCSYFCLISIEKEKKRTETAALWNATIHFIRLNEINVEKQVPVPPKNLTKPTRINIPALIYCIHLQI